MTATLDLAERILGVRSARGKAACQEAFRRACFERHPDRGGNTREMMRVNAAWSYMRAVKGW